MTNWDVRGRRIGVVGLLTAGTMLVIATNTWAQLGGRDRLRNFGSAGNSSASKAKMDDVLDKLNDTDDHERRLEGLGQLAAVDDRTKAIGYLLAASNDPDASIRVKAITTLGVMQAQEAVAPMVQRLFMRDTDLQTKRHILAALGQIGDKRATKPILDFLLDDDVDRDTRGTAIYALGEIGDESALEPLSQIANAEGEQPLGSIARTAAHKITHRPTPDVTPPALLTDAERRQQAEQAQAAAQGN
jgi:HEAT repeat protein